MPEQLSGLNAALIVAEHLPREEDGTATIMEVAQRRHVLLAYLREARAGADRLEAENARLREALRQARACMEWCINLGADGATATSLREGVMVIDEAGGDRA